MRYGEALSLDEITGNVEVDGALKRRQIWREVISQKKGWAVIVILAQDKERGGWSKPLLWISKWRKVAQRWVRQSDVKLNSEQWESLMDYRELLYIEAEKV